MPEVQILNSWKEISNYIGRGVRTVQRWEELYGLPVHRAAGRDRSAVYALSDEVDAWLRSGKMHEAPAPSREVTPEIVERYRMAVDHTTALLERLRMLRQQTRELRTAISRSRARQALDEMQRLQQELPATLEKMSALAEGRMIPAVRPAVRTKSGNGSTHH